MSKGRTRGYSRRKSVERKEAVKGVFYLVLAAILAVGIFLWGLPAAIRLVGKVFLNENTVGTQVAEYLSTPVIDVLPEATNSASLQVTGYAEEGVEVGLYLNNIKEQEVVAGKEGVFEFELKLKKGENFVYVKVRKGKVEKESEKYTVIFDQKPPKIEITSPDEGSEFRGEDKRVVTIKGKVDEEVEELKVGERLAIIKDNGEWEVDYLLQEGEQEIVIEARDKAGNVGKTSLRLSWFGG